VLEGGVAHRRSAFCRVRLNLATCTSDLWGFSGDASWCLGDCDSVPDGGPATTATERA